MDDFFDKVKEQAYKAKDNASKITKQIVDKTGNIVGQTKLAFAANETEDKIKDIFAELGKTVYEKYKADGDICECMEERCKKIDVLYEEVAELRSKLAELKDSIKCQNCGEFNKKSADFCSKCGNSLKAKADYEDFSYRYDDDDVISIKSVKPTKNEAEEE